MTLMPCLTCGLRISSPLVKESPKGAVEQAECPPRGYISGHPVRTLFMLTAVLTRLALVGAAASALFITNSSKRLSPSTRIVTGSNLTVPSRSYSHVRPFLEPIFSVERDATKFDFTIVRKT